MIINDLFESSYAGNTERAVARNMNLNTNQLKVAEGLQPDSDLAVVGVKILNALKAKCEEIDREHPHMWETLTSDEWIQSGAAYQFVKDYITVDKHTLNTFFDAWEDVGGDPFQYWPLFWRDGQWDDFIAPWRQYAHDVLKSRGVNPTPPGPVHEDVTEGSEERRHNRLWQMITDYEKRAKATSNDIKKAHYLKMAGELRGKLKTSDEQSVVEASPEATFNALKGLKTWQVVIMNNYYRGKYSDYSGRYYYVLATSPEQARQVVLGNADAILQDLLSMKSVNGKKILPRGSALRITADRIGEIRDGTEAGRMTTMGYKKMFGPQGPMMVKLNNGAIADVQGQEQGVAEGSDGAVSFREMIDVVDQHYPKYYAELSGSDISDKQFERAIVNAYKEIIKKQGVAEGYDKWGWHTSVTNGEFMPTKYGNKAYVYLHDMDNQSANGNPQLVTFNKPTHAKKAAAQFGGKVVKTDLNTYRVVKPAEQGVTESIKAMVKQATSREDLRQIRKFVAENVADQKAQRKIMEQATHIVAVQRRKHAAQAAK